MAHPPGLYCPQCSHPVTGRDATCPQCSGALMDEDEAAKGREGWERLPESARREFDALYQQRCRDWERSYGFYERTSKRKHMVFGALLFGVAGIPCGAMALAYALAGALGGLILSRQKGGILLGIVVGAGVFAVVLGVRTVMAMLLPVDRLTLLWHAASTYYADRIIALVCPAAGGLFGYFIENEFEWW